jgi:exoribonuclease R
MATGLDDIRADGGIPESFPDEVSAAARRAALRPLGDGHADRTGRRFVTLDPASSVDLDQAFAIEMAGDEIIA